MFFDTPFPPSLIKLALIISADVWRTAKTIFCTITGPGEIIHVMDEEALLGPRSAMVEKLTMKVAFIYNYCVSIYIQFTIGLVQ